MPDRLMAESLIRDIPDFPKPGIIFKDITPVLRNHKAFAEVVERMIDCARKKSPDVVVGIESRGFILGSPIALKMGVGFVPVRKVGKLPHECVRATYELEYGTSTMEMHRDALRPGQRVLIVDDLLATGGTAAASARMVEELGGRVVGFVFLIELAFLHGRDQLAGYDVTSLVTY